MSAAVGERAVCVARRWIGTPYRHQATVEAAGCDCLGLLRGVWRELYGAEPMRVPDYTADWAEPQGHERLWQVAAAHLKIKPTGDEAVGDVLLFRMRRGAVAKHLGLQSVVGSQATFVHAYQGHGVVESPLSAPWRAKVVARFALPQEEF